MYKNQLQELAQRSCFNLPSYACIREGPDHAPRFKASVNFNGEIFESPSYCTTLRQAEHSAAEVALNALSSRCPSRSLTARILDETGIYKNLLQETAHRAGLGLPVYTTTRSGPGHVPVFTCTVELAGMTFTGEPAKTKKQAQKNAAIAAWSALKKMPILGSSSMNNEVETHDEHDQEVVSRILSSFGNKDEARQVKRRDQNNQARRRMTKAHGHNSSYVQSSPFIINSHHHLRQCSVLDLLMESTSESSTKKQNSFVSLLPPPPPPTTSKILPPSSPLDNSSPLHTNRPSSDRLKGKSWIVSPPVDDHLKDEEEWLGGAGKSVKDGKNDQNSGYAFGSSSSIYGQFLMSNKGKLGTSSLGVSRTRNEQTQVGKSLIGFSNPFPMDSFPKRHLPIRFQTGGFNPQRIAPAVQIRSVIPVCAAPPTRVSLQSDPIQKKETLTSTTMGSTPHLPLPSSFAMSTQARAEVCSPSSESETNKPETQSTQPGSENFNKLKLN